MGARRTAHGAWRTENGNPGLLATFEYIHFATPEIPPARAGANFSDISAVSDAELIDFLGN